MQLPPLFLIAAIHPTADNNSEITLKTGESVCVMMSAEDVVAAVHKCTPCFPPHSHQPKVDIIALQSHKLEAKSVSLLWREMAKDDMAKMIEGTRFRVSHCNADYSVCATYPQSFVVPQCVSDTVIRHAARFRSHNRLAVLSFIYRSSLLPSSERILSIPDRPPHDTPSEPGTVGVMIRSSQPLAGLTNRRSTQDEFLVRSMASASTQSLVIVDARSQASVLANAVQGRGTESVEGYKALRLVYLNLPNMHAVREWLPTRTADREDGEEGPWWRGVERVKEAARQICDLVGTGHAVLVHCSDGWDRTPQLTSLSALMLQSANQQPVTRDQLLTLVQREWISMGHRFATRHSHHLPPHATTVLPATSESAPIFLQFLDCLRTMPACEGLSQVLGELERDCFDPRGPFRGDCDRDRLL